MTGLKQLSSNSLKGISATSEEIIKYHEGPAIVSAGPGSGKTYVLIHKIRYLIEQLNINPASIVVISYTRASALEIKNRFHTLTGSEYGDVVFGTFHSIFYNFIKLSGIRDLNFISVNDKYKILKQVLINRKINNLNNLFLTEILREFSVVINSGININEYFSPTLREGFKTVFTDYHKRCEALNYVDYDDILRICHNKAFDDDFKVMIKSLYEYILIDEFQDINYIQYDTVVRLFGNSNVFAVGDEDQAIYSFRGSDPRYMFEFTKDFPKAKVFMMTNNHRCKESIVKRANSLIKHNINRFDKESVALSEDKGLVKVIPYKMNSDESQAVFDIINEKINEGMEYKDIAILFRTNTFNPGIMRKLVKERVPLNIKEKKISMTDREVIKDILGYLRISRDMDDKEDWLRILNKPVRFMPLKDITSNKPDIDELIYRARKTKYLYDAMCRLKKDIEKLRNLSLYEGIIYILTVIGYKAYLKDNLKVIDNYSENLRLIEDLLDISKEYEELEDLIYVLNNYDVEKRGNDDGINIMTMHASKGLEFKVVILPDIESGRVPKINGHIEDNLSEERRIFYVAVTRAKDNLYILHDYTNPSMFIKEMGK